MEGIKTETAIIALDEDTSINAAPRELQEEYELARVSGDKERIEEVLTILWEDYGIHGKNPPARETSGIKRLAIMHDDGVNVSPQFSSGAQPRMPTAANWESEPIRSQQLWSEGSRLLANCIISYNACILSELLERAERRQDYHGPMRSSERTRQAGSM